MYVTFLEPVQSCDRMRLFFHCQRPVYTPWRSPIWARSMSRSSEAHPDNDTQPESRPDFIQVGLRPALAAALQAAFPHVEVYSSEDYLYPHFSSSVASYKCTS